MNEVLDPQSDPASAKFSVKLDNFEGPFDLLLQLIARHQLDITEVALSVVTDDFIAHVKRDGATWDLDAASSFVVVAATLLDLKTAKLLPHGDVEDLDDLELLEAKDLLFARLLQYRAFKIIASWVEGTLAQQQTMWPRSGGLEEQFSRLLPEVELSLTPEEFAKLALKAMTPREVAAISLEHLHRHAVSVKDEAARVVARLRESSPLTFRQLTTSADRLTVVARFLALLELYREKAVSFEQLNPLGELVVRWSGGQADTIEISDDFDGAEGASS